MSDLEGLLIREAEIQGQKTVPDFESVRARRARRDRTKRVSFAAGSAMALAISFGVWQVSTAEDALTTAAGGAPAARDYFTVQYASGTVRAAEASLDECLQLPEAALDQRSDDLLPIQTVSVGGGEEVREGFASCLSKISGLRVSAAQRSEVPVVASTRRYSLAQRDLEAYDEAVFTNELEACSVQHGASTETVAFSIPPVPTVKFVALPGEQAQFEACLRDIPNVEVSTTPDK